MQNLWWKPKECTTFPSETIFDTIKNDFIIFDKDFEVPQISEIALGHSAIPRYGKNTFLYVTPLSASFWMSFCAKNMQ